MTARWVWTLALAALAVAVQASTVGDASARTPGHAVARRHEFSGLVTARGEGPLLHAMTSGVGVSGRVAVRGDGTPSRTAHRVTEFLGRVVTRDDKTPAHTAAHGAGSAGRMVTRGDKIPVQQTAHGAGSSDRVTSRGDEIPGHAKPHGAESSSRGDATQGHVAARGEAADDPRTDDDGPSAHVMTSVALVEQPDQLDAGAWLSTLFGTRLDEDEAHCAKSDRVLHRPSGQCHDLFSRGPCARKEWLVLDKARARRDGTFVAVCAPRPCAPGFGLDPRRSRCFRNTTCPAGTLMVYDFFGGASCGCDGVAARMEAAKGGPACRPLFRRKPCLEGSILAPRYRLFEGVDAICFRDPCSHRAAALAEPAPPAPPPPQRPHTLDGIQPIWARANDDDDDRIFRSSSPPPPRRQRDPSFVFPEQTNSAAPRGDDAPTYKHVPHHPFHHPFVPRRLPGPHFGVGGGKGYVPHGKGFGPGPQDPWVDVDIDTPEGGDARAVTTLTRAVLETELPEERPGAPHAPPKRSHRGRRRARGEPRIDSAEARAQEGVPAAGRDMVFPDDAAAARSQLVLLQDSNGDIRCLNETQLNATCAIEMAPLLSPFSAVAVPVCAESLFRYSVGRTGKLDCAEDDSGKCQPTHTHSDEPYDWDLEEEDFRVKRAV